MASHPAQRSPWRVALRRCSSRARLKRLELEPRVIDAHEVRRKAHRPEQKSDPRDAQELGEGLRRGFYRSVMHVPSPEIEELRTALSRRRHFIRIQTAEVNAVKRLLKRLETVPGVSPIVALTVLAVFSEVSRFPSAKHAASYGGLVPSTFESGERDAHGHITKRGSSELRAMLCEAAHHARLRSHPLNPHFARICARLQGRGDRRRSSPLPHLVRDAT